jgi:hypothetical protein
MAWIVPPVATPFERLFKFLASDARVFIGQADLTRVSCCSVMSQINAAQGGLLRKKISLRREEFLA